MHWINIHALQPNSAQIEVVPNRNDVGVLLALNPQGDGSATERVETGAPVPPGYLVDSVQLCFELPSPGTSILAIHVRQVRDALEPTLVLSDPTPITDAGPACVSTTPDKIVSPEGEIDPELGSLLVGLDVKFGTSADLVRVISAALHLVRRP
jgi:hypothetical protein